MFALSIVRKYLIPRKGHLSMTLIALMSITVISLVVWLIILFLSVTEGIEKNWLDKLTAIHAPIKITPTERYFSSYYYLSDTVSQGAHYTPRTLHDKIVQGDRYNPDIDETIPSSWPKRDLPTDPAVTAYEILSRFDGVTFQEFEVSGAVLRLQLTRPTPQGGVTHQFLTQASYLAAFPDKNPELRRLILPPSKNDQAHIQFLAERDPTVVETMTLLHEKLVLPTLHSNERGVVLAKQFVDTGVRIGDKGWLTYPASTAGALQEQRLPIYVAGFYDPGVLSIGNKSILAPASIVHLINTNSQVEHFDKTNSTGFSIWHDDLKLSKEIAQAIQQRFAQANIDAYWKVSTYHDYDFAKDLLQQFQSDRSLFTLIGLIILLVACSNIISLLVILVNDKRKEIGILQALGAPRKTIAFIFGGVGACLGLVSGCLGVGAAILTLRNLDSLIHFLSLIQGHQPFNALFYGSSLPHTLSTGAIVFVLIVTPLLSLLAGLIPAIKACRLSPSAILRSE